MPVYLVRKINDDNVQPYTRLIDAPNTARVRDHIMRDFRVDVATAAECVAVGQSGGKIEQADQ